MQVVIDALAAGLRLPAMSPANVPLSAVTLLAPIPRPRRNLWCVGRNFHAHAKELSASVFRDNSQKTDEWPIVFTKVPECVVGPYDRVVMPSDVSSQIDYEAELAVIIGKGGKNIPRSAALGHVFGYTIVNDVTARDLQNSDGQWTRAKGFDTFCPFGPWIDTDFDPSDSVVTCRVNGQMRQMASTRDMVFNVSTLIAYISSIMTLEPGDLIFTGTPSGVGLLKDGDEVSVEIEGLGEIKNKVKAEAR